MSNDIANTLVQVDQAIKTGMGIAALKDQERIRSVAALRTQLKEADCYVPPPGDGALRDEVDMLAKKVQRLQAELADRDVLIRDWMHSNEAFKRLHKSYGKKVGLTDEQMKSDFHQAALDIAEEDPKFANTDFGKRVKERVKKAS